MRYYKTISRASITSGGPDDVTYVLPDGRCFPADLNNSDWVDLKAAIDGGDATEIAIGTDWPPEALPPPPAALRPRPARNPDGTPAPPA